MADLPSEFWGGWIAAITVASFVALLWFVIDVYRSGPDGNEQQVWDETLREGTKPAPIWWFWFILALMIISVVYVMLYPGLGSWRGALGWSMGGRIEERFVDYEGQFGTQRSLILELPLDELANSNTAMQSAGRVFNNNCSSCHGSDGGRTGAAVSGPDGCRVAMGLGRVAGRRDDSFRPPGGDARMACGRRRSMASTTLPTMCCPYRAAGRHAPLYCRRPVVPAVLRGLPWSGRRRQRHARRTGTQ